MTQQRSLTLIAVAISAALSTSAFAQTKAPEPDYTLSYNIGAVTEYRYRGISQSAREPALLAGQRVRYAGHTLVLTRLEYGLLRTLVAAPTRIHSRASLLDAVWTEGSEAGDRTVDTHIKTLRAKLREKTPDFDPIVTHRGLGYALAAEKPR